MSMSDPIADMLTRIRNAQGVGRRPRLQCRRPKVKVAIADVLKDEGYIEDFAVAAERTARPRLENRLEVLRRRPVIERSERVSALVCVFTRARMIFPSVMNGLGVAIVSTAEGRMTDRKARANGIGGEVLCVVA